MFEHVAMLLSFVYALALTHLLLSMTGLVLARDRVRFSGLHAVWMGIAFLVPFANWLEIWPYRAIGRWSMVDVALLFATAVSQYFICSLVSPKAEEAGQIDMVAFHERQRPAFLAAFAAWALIAIVLNYVERNQTAGLSATAWIGEDALCVPFLVLFGVSAFARQRWLLWTSAIVVLALSLAAVALYTPLG